MKTQFFQASFKSRERVGQTLKIRGYASTGDEDRYNDIVSPDAFTNSLKNYIDRGGIVLLQHNHDQVIGKTLTGQIDAKGLFVEIELNNDIKEDDQEKSLFQLIESGNMNAFSIGFIAKKIERDENYTKRTINEVDLLEISVVAIPANPNAMFIVSKSFEDTIAGDEETLQLLDPSKLLTISKSLDILLKDLPENEGKSEDQVDDKSVGNTNNNEANPENVDEISTSDEKDAGNAEDKTIGDEEKSLETKAPGFDTKAFEEKIFAKFEEKLIAIKDDITQECKKELDEISKTFKEVFDANSDNMNEEVKALTDHLIEIVGGLQKDFEIIDNRVAGNYKGLNKVGITTGKSYNANDFMQEIINSKYQDQ